MIEKDTQEKLRLRYLLGQATDEERTEVEERYLSDNECFEELLALEDALVDEYVMGRMPESQRLVFEENLTDSQRENVEFTRTVVQEFQAQRRKKNTKKKQAPGLGTSSAPDSPRGGFRAAFSSNLTARMALVMLLAGVVVGLPMLWWSSSLQHQREEARKQTKALRDEQAELREKIENLTGKLDGEQQDRRDLQLELALVRDGAGVASPDEQKVALESTSMSRGSGASTMSIELRTRLKHVRFEIPLEAPAKYPSYSISIRMDGTVIEEFRNVKPRAGKISLPVLARKLESQAYILTLSGEREGQAPTVIERYPFRIQKGASGR